MEISQKTKEYWQEQDWKDLETAEDNKQLLEIALRVLGRMPEPIGQVCGPISTGGRGSVLENLVAFNETIVFLQADGKIIFDQMPFEGPMQRMKDSLPPGVYGPTILNDFYLPIFNSGLIKKLYFMPDWQSSIGAKWEHDKAKELGIEIAYL